MGATDELLENARAYAASFDRDRLPARPRRRVAVLTCMDARVNPYGILGLREGDAHVISNAGGVVTDDEIRSLAISQHLLGTEEIILIQHTDCGLLKVTEEEVKARLEEAAGQRPEWDSHAFDDLDGNVRAQARKIRDSPFIPRKDSIRGFVYEVESGRLREVT